MKMCGFKIDVYNDKLDYGFPRSFQGTVTFDGLNDCQVTLCILFKSEIPVSTDLTSELMIKQQYNQPLAFRSVMRGSP